MDTKTEIIELKFDGNGIKPSKVKASEIAELIISYEKAITAIILDSYPEIREDYLFISFEEIKESSLSLKHLAHNAKKYVYPSLFLIANAFQTNNFNQIPNSAITDLRAITHFAKKYGCEGYFIKDGESIASFDATTEVAYNKSEIVKGETVLYGEIKGISEKKIPRVSFRINDSYSISFEVKKEFAKKLGSSIFEFVGLKGVATWDRKTYKVLDFKAEDIIVLENNTLSETFEELRSKLGPHIDKHGDYNNYLG